MFGQLRWSDSAQETDGSGASVNVKDGPKRQGNVNVHQKGGGASVPHHRHFAAVRQVEFDFVTKDRSVSDIFGNDPIFRSKERERESMD